MTSGGKGNTNALSRYSGATMSAFADVDHSCNAASMALVETNFVALDQSGWAAVSRAGHLHTLHRVAPIHGIVILWIVTERLLERVGVGRLLFLDRDQAGDHDPSLPAYIFATGYSRGHRIWPQSSLGSLRPIPSVRSVCSFGPIRSLRLVQPGSGRGAEGAHPGRAAEILHRQQRRGIANGRISNRGGSHSDGIDVGLLLDVNAASLGLAHVVDHLQLGVRRGLRDGVPPAGDCLLQIFGRLVETPAVLNDE